MNGDRWSAISSKVIWWFFAINERIDVKGFLRINSFADRVWEVGEHLFLAFAVDSADRLVYLRADDRVSERWLFSDCSTCLFICCCA